MDHSPIQTPIYAHIAQSATLTAMQGAVMAAAASLLADFAALKQLDIRSKGPGDFVSQADTKAEGIIVGSLRDAYPDWGFLGEEGTAITGKDARYRWIIDPLDGTNNFIHGFPHWCVTVALEKDGVIIAGMTYDPLLKELYYAEQGKGAFMNGAALSISARSDMKDALVLVDPGHARRDDAWFSAFMTAVAAGEQQAAAVRIGGSGALDLCYLAAGRFDVMYHAGGAKPWDIAAGFLFLREVGGIVTDMALSPIDHMEGRFLAAKPSFHAEFAKLLSL
jgi:myo-inositol-1(or 4)-monophosphatase